jgi:hypothetical protein
VKHWFVRRAKISYTLVWRVVKERALTPQEKKNYLLAKYTKRDYKVEDLKPKFAVYFNPSIEKIKDWTLVCVTDTEEQSLKEILWRKMFHEHNDSELVIENDERFKTFSDETKHKDQNGNTYEPGQELMKIDYNTSGGMMQVIAGSPPANNSTGFKGLGHYMQFDLNYKEIYKIEKIYEV